MDFKKYQLDNGLRLVVHSDYSTPMAVVNTLYDVGARDESPQRTGFAHLFEHLMFAGSENVTDFDQYLQYAGGESNAFTNSDMTNYYDTLPAENVETALWLEADRMVALNINERSLEVQRKVVVEEFYETCLNIPYGDVWHRICGLAFRKHPYRWPTIGLEPRHIKEARLEEVRRFYKKHYAPNNAVLVVAGPLEPEAVLAMVEKYFGHIPAAPPPKKDWPQEPPQTEARRQSVSAKVPLDALYMVFHTVERRHPDYYAVDLLSDILCNGKSSRLYRKVKKRMQLFAEIESYITASSDPGLLLVEGRLAESVSFEQAEAAVWSVIEEVKAGDVSERELRKYKNKAVSSLVFGECDLVSRAMWLAYYEAIGLLEEMNQEPERYHSVTTEDIVRVANQFLSHENVSVIQYQRES